MAEGQQSYGQLGGIGQWKLGGEVGTGLNSRYAVILFGTGKLFGVVNRKELLDGNNGRDSKEPASAWARRSKAAASRRRLSFVINCYQAWRRPKTSCADLKPLHPTAINTGRCFPPCLLASLSVLRPKTGYLYQMIGSFHDLHQLQPSQKETIRDMPNTQDLIHLLSSICPPAHMPTYPPAHLRPVRLTLRAAAGPPRHVVVLCRRGRTAKI